MLNTATSLISDVIGTDAESSAFVYGAYSFFDKVANGLIIFVITSKFNHSDEALRWIIGLTPIICSILAFLLTYLGKILYAERLARLSITEKDIDELNNGQSMLTKGTVQQDDVPRK